MKWKLEIANVRANERLLLKEHLDQMSERGWDLKRIGSFYLLYESAMDPCSWHIGFNDDAAMLNAPRYIGISAQKQIDLYEEMGYTFVTAFRCLMIYRSEKGAAEVFSDAQTEAAAMEKALREERFFRVYAPCALLLLLLLIPLCQPAPRLMLLSDTFALSAYLFALLSELVLAAFFFQRKKRASSWRSIRLRPWGWLIVLMGLITAMLCCVWAFTGSASIVSALIVEGAVLTLLSILFAQISSMAPSRTWGYAAALGFVLLIPLSALLCTAIAPLDTQASPAIVQGMAFDDVQDRQSALLHHVRGGSDELSFDYIALEEPFLLPAAQSYLLERYPMRYERRMQETDIYLPDTTIPDAISAANGETLRLGRAVLLIQEDRALYVHDQRGEQAYTESELLALIHEMAR